VVAGCGATSVDRSDRRQDDGVEQVEFSDGAIQVVVLPEAGARIHRLRAFGHDLLRTPADPEEHLRDRFFWGSYVMAPWCGRIDTGPVPIGARVVDLGSNFPDGTAIHGQVHTQPWERRGDGTFYIEGGGDGWPWNYEARLRVEVREPTVRLDLSLVNRSSDPMPAGLGIHPWFRRPVRLAIRGDAYHSPNTATPPHAERVLGHFDLRKVGQMADDLDATWTDLADPPVELVWPDAEIRARMWSTPPVAYVVAASPSDVDAIAVEPQTHAPQGLRRLVQGEPGGLTMLGPGQSLGLTVELAFERLGRLGRLEGG
jgi:aldose 1-epimerase